MSSSAAPTQLPSSSSAQARGRLLLGISLVLCLGHVAAFAPGHPRRSYYDPPSPFLQYIPDKDDDIAFAPSHNTQAGFVWKSHDPNDVNAEEEEERLWQLRQEERRRRRRKGRRTDSAFDRIRQDETTERKREPETPSSKATHPYAVDRDIRHESRRNVNTHKKIENEPTSSTMFAYRGEGRKDVIYQRPSRQRTKPDSPRIHAPRQHENRRSQPSRAVRHEKVNDNDDRDPPDWMPISERLDNRSRQSVRPPSDSKRVRSSEERRSSSSTKATNNRQTTPMENSNKKNDEDYKRHRHAPREKVDTWAGSRVPQKSQLSFDEEGKPQSQFTKERASENPYENTEMPETWAGSKVKQRSHLSLDARGKPRTQFLRGGKPEGDPVRNRSMPETWAGSKVKQGSRIESQVTMKPDEKEERPLNPEEAEAERARVRREKEEQAVAAANEEPQEEEDDDDNAKDGKEPFFQEDYSEHAYFNDNHFHDKEPQRRRFRPRGAGGCFNLWTKPNPMEMKEYSASSHQRQPFLQQPNTDPSFNRGRVIREPYREELYYPDNEFDSRPQGNLRDDDDRPRNYYRSPEDSYYYNSVNNKNYNKYGDFNMGEDRGPRFWQANGGSSARMGRPGGRYMEDFDDDEDDYFDDRQPFPRRRMANDRMNDRDMFIPRERQGGYEDDFRPRERHEMHDFARRSQQRDGQFMNRSNGYYSPPSERRAFGNNGPSNRGYDTVRPRYPEERQMINNRVSYSKRKSSCEIDSTTKTQRSIPGDGTFVSFAYDESVSTIRLTLWTEEGLPLQSVVDLIQNDSKRVRTIAQVSNDGLQGPFSQLIDVMPNQGGGVLEITNQGPYDFQLNALVEPVEMEIN